MKILRQNFSKTQFLLKLSLILLSLQFFSSCQTMNGLNAFGGAKHPLAKIDAIKLFSYYDKGKPMAYAEVSGLKNPRSTLSNRPRQENRGYRIYIELEEIDHTPKDYMQTQELVPYTKRVDINLRGMQPQVYIVNINGKEEHLEVLGEGGRMGGNNQTPSQNWGNDAVPRLPKGMGQELGKFFDKFLR